MVREDTRLPTTDSDSVFRLLELADFIVPFTIGVVAELGVADELAEGPRSVEELAEATGAHPRSLHRALRCLASKGIFTEVEPACFGLTPMAELLRSDHPTAFRRLCLTFDPEVQALMKLGHSLRTGESSLEDVYQQGFWDYLAENRQLCARFDELMEAFTRLELMAVLPAYDWSSIGTICDVGGGNGAFLAGLLAKNPSLSGMIYDLANVVSGADAVMKDAGVRERCQIVAGSFHESVPGGLDVYLMKRIIYSYDDTEAALILSNVRAAMGPDNRLLVVEPVWRKGDRFDVGKIMDMKMLALGKGFVRRRDEHRKLFAQVGLELTRVIPTTMPAIVEARPI